MPEPADALKSALAALSDDQVCAMLRALVGGLVHGMITDITARADEIVDNIVDSITEQLTTAAGPSNDDQKTEPPAPPPAPTPPPPAAEPSLRTLIRAQDAIEHTCELCGRTGTRRFIPTQTGWRCAPSSSEKCRRRQGAQAEPARPAPPEHAHRLGRGLPGQTTTPPPPAPRPAPPAPRPAPPAERPSTQRITPETITAKCQDCHRIWTGTGPETDTAIEQHELTKSHIVDRLEHPHA